VEKGVITGLKEGTAELTISYGELGKTVSITVISGSDDLVPDMLLIDPQEIEIGAGEETEITVQALYPEGSGKYMEDVTLTATYSLNPTGIASVEKGVITGLKEGTAELTISYGELGKTVSITVISGSDDLVPDMLLIDPQEIEIGAGEETEITVQALYPEGSGKYMEDVTLTATYSLNPTGIASVEKGVITGLKEGTAELTISYGELGKTVSITVISGSDDLVPDMLLIDPQEIEIGAGEETEITVQALYPEGSGKYMEDVTLTATYSLNPTGIASVEKGVITGLKEGTAELTISYGELGKTVSITVISGSDDLVPDMLLIDPQEIEIGAGEETEITVQALYPEGSGKYMEDVTLTATYSLNPTGIASVEKGVITGLKEGTAELTISYGELGKTVSITVISGSDDLVPDMLLIDPQEIEIGAGEETEITVQALYPEGSGKYMEDVTLTATYSLNPTGIASVEKGVITGLKEGTAELTISYGELGKTVSITVISGSDDLVPDMLLIDPQEIEIGAGEETEITVQALYPEGSGKYMEDVTLTATYSLNPTGIASVEKGVITGLKEGTAELTIAYGGIETTVRVIVCGDETWTDYTATTQKSSNDYWTITFNKDTDPTSINTSNIFVATDEAGNNKVDGVSVNQVDSNARQVRVGPPEGGWQEGETYYLFINKKVKSADGMALSRGIRMRFSVRAEVETSMSINR
jgi:uncharacterized cupredoxin-like copper-binding protein